MSLLTCIRNLIAGVQGRNSFLYGRYQRVLTEIHIFQLFDLKFGMCVLTCIRNLMVGFWMGIPT